MKHFLSYSAKTSLVVFVIFSMISANLIGLIGVVSVARAQENSEETAVVEETIVSDVSDDTAEKIVESVEEKVEDQATEENRTANTSNHNSGWGNGGNNWGGHDNGYGHGGGHNGGGHDNNWGGHGNGGHDNGWGGHDGHDNGDGDDGNGDNGQGGGDENPALGSIRVCKIIVDENMNVITTPTPAGITFTIAGTTTPTEFGPAIAELPTTVITTPMTLNTNHIYYNSDDIDANCTTYSDLALGNYYYEAEVISGDETEMAKWEAPLYHDEVEDYLYIFDYLVVYGTNYTSDGHILLTEELPTRTLIVANKMKPAVDNGDGGDGDDNDDGNGGGQGGGDDTTDTTGQSGGTAIGGGSVGSNVLVVSTPANTSSPTDTSTNTEGQVLGESTCAPLLNKYMRRGYKNDADEVKKLQAFLNTELNLNLAVSGEFDLMTEQAARLFQVKYPVEILSPWKINNSTGIVYLTTRTKINNISCATLNLENPTNLVNWKDNPETEVIPVENK